MSPPRPASTASASSRSGRGWSRLGSRPTCWRCGCAGSLGILSSDGSRRLDGLTIRALEAADVQPIAAAFAAIGWDKPASQYERYLAEQARGERVVLVASVDERFAGYLTIVWQSGHPPFRAAGIPEIVDFNVLPHVRRRGIGGRLMDEAERLIAARSAEAGIG